MYQNFNLGVGGPCGAIASGPSARLGNEENQVAAPANGVIQDGTVFKTSLRNETGKVTWQLNQANKIIGYGHMRDQVAAESRGRDQPHRQSHSHHRGVNAEPGTARVGVQG